MFKNEANKFTTLSNELEFSYAIHSKVLDSDMLN